MDVLITDAVASDAPKLNQLRVAAIVEVAKKNPHIVGLNQAFDWQKKDSTERLKYFIADSKRWVKVARDRETGKPIGYVIVRSNEVERLFVTPKCQKKGVGTLLLKEAEVYIAKSQAVRGFPSLIKLDSFVTSRSFYERLGYVAIWSRKFTMDRSVIFTYWMVKDLTDAKIRPDTENMSLADARRIIDHCDRSILDSLLRRFAVTEWVGEHKAQNDLPSYDEDREMRQREMLKDLSETYALPEDLVQIIFGLIRDVSKVNHYEIRQSSHFSLKK